jgi:hypothetical protein
MLQPAIDIAVGEGLYVYAVGRPRHAGMAGRLPGEGIVEHSPVQALAYRDLLCLYSRVPLDQFGREAVEQNLQEPDWVRRRVLAHQAVLISLLSHYTIVPFRFCTVYLGEDRVLSALDAHYAPLDRALRELQGATEWGVKAFSNMEILAAHVEATSTGLQAQREAVARAKPGTAYFLRKKLEQAARREAEPAATQMAQALHARLAAQARRARVNTMQSAAEHGQCDEMFLNAAYLVDDENWPAFRAAFDGLAESFGAQGFTLDLTGPWPPYNFADWQ